ncbi:MAG: RDD family protein [Methylotenera sp.]|nr:RDD family protein [Methylotenera sp.]
MTTTDDQRFAPPQAHVQDIATGEPVLAGRGARLLAAIIDGLIAGAAVWAAFMLPGLSSIAEAHQQAAARGFWAFNAWSLLLGVPLFLLIQGWPLLTRGQTLGKILLKMRIVRTDGSKVDPLRLFGLRYGVGILTGVMSGLSMIYGLVDSLLIFRGSRQCLHDTIADTKVIKL